MRNITDKVCKAAEMAMNAHEGQSYKGCPYYSYHVQEVAYTIDNAGYSEDYIIAALLHDVLEDSDKYTAFDIHFNFGAEVAKAVNQLTKQEGFTYQEYLNQITSPIARVVKIYDANFNLTENLKEGNLKRAKKYAMVLNTLLEVTW